MARKKCWHCADLGACDCITCGRDEKKGTEVRVSAPCKACAGRAFYDRNRAFLSKFNPCDRSNWIHHPAADGNPVRREYVPLRGLK